MAQSTRTLRSHTQRKSNLTPCTASEEQNLITELYSTLQRNGWSEKELVGLPVSSFTTKPVTEDKPKVDSPVRGPLADYQMQLARLSELNARVDAADVYLRAKWRRVPMPLEKIKETRNG